MINKRIVGTTRVCGKDQGYISLSVRDEKVEGFSCMATAWEPTPEELKTLNNGKNVVIRTTTYES